MKENTLESQTLRGELRQTVASYQQAVKETVRHRLTGKLLEQPQAMATEPCPFSSIKSVRG